MPQSRPHSQVALLKALSHELDTDKLHRKFLQMLLSLQHVERGSIWVKVDNTYKCIDALGGECDAVLNMTLPADKPSIAGWVIENGTMTVARVGQDERHFKEIEESLDVKSSLILCFPLLLKDGSVYGAVELIDTSSQGDVINLDPDYLALLQDLVDICSNVLGNSLQFSATLLQNRQLQETLQSFVSGSLVHGQSALFQDAWTLAMRYARTDYPVLIQGESGSGKELFAREICKNSARNAKPFQVLNCSAIPPGMLEIELFGYAKGAFTGAHADRPGLFESANGGTLLLDEIAEMEPAFQTKLLRVLQDCEIKPIGGPARRVDVRLIASTNTNLEERVRKGLFREDLFYRLNVLPLRVPPLRERPEDIPDLIAYFVRREANAMNIAPPTVSRAAMDALCANDWPGNVRELESCVKERMTLGAGKAITLHDVPKPRPRPRVQPEPAAAPPQQQVAPTGAHLLDMADKDWEEVEKGYALYLLDACNWNISRAAAKAGLIRSTFDTRLKRLGIRKKKRATA
ncbi:MAG: sigma-54 interaction domain-containing protein [Desulfovibrionaceae bacterium]